MAMPPRTQSGRQMWAAQPRGTEDAPRLARHPPSIPDAILPLCLLTTPSRSSPGPAARRRPEAGPVSRSRCLRSAGSTACHRIRMDRQPVRSRHSRGCRHRRRSRPSEHGIAIGEHSPVQSGAERLGGCLALPPMLIAKMVDQETVRPPRFRPLAETPGLVPPVIGFTKVEWWHGQKAVLGQLRRDRKTRRAVFSLRHPMIKQRSLAGPQLESDPLYHGSGAETPAPGAIPDAAVDRIQQTKKGGIQAAPYPAIPRIHDQFFVLPSRRAELHALLLSSIAWGEPAGHPVRTLPMKSLFFAALDLPRPAGYRVFLGILNPQ